MKKNDYYIQFASAALQGLLSQNTRIGIVKDISMAIQAFDLADKMMEVWEMKQAGYTGKMINIKSSYGETNNTK